MPAYSFSVFGMEESKDVCLEHRMGVEPMNTGFADQRVSHFATGASTPPRISRDGECRAAY
jgi:hypothetical protein